MRGLYSLTSATGLEILSLYDTLERLNPSYLESADGVTYFDDRLWVYNCKEQDGNKYSQRIRWSWPGNFDVFRTQDYIDLPYSEGEIIALIPMGSLLIAYFTDAIYVGRQTSIIGLPYKFERLEIGNTGLINQKAVVSWVDGHFFVGQDNIYFLSGNAALQEIGSTVLQETLDYAKSIGLENKIQAEHDPTSNTIAFYFPEFDNDAQVGVESYSSKVWRWNYRTNLLEL